MVAVPLDIRRGSRPHTLVGFNPLYIFDEGVVLLTLVGFNPLYIFDEGVVRLPVRLSASTLSTASADVSATGTGPVERGLWTFCGSKRMIQIESSACAM
jgi:hypothetical protein